MRTYIIRRVLLVIPTLFILSILVFLSVRFLPGDAIDAMLDKAGWIGATGVDRAALEKMLGLDVPAYVQYGRWLGDIVLHGTLGNSLWGGEAIEAKIIGRLPVTIELGALAIVIGLVIAIPLGLVALVIGIIEIVLVFTDPEGRRIGDKMASTRVIETDA